jgi:hypothetical protein
MTLSDVKGTFKDFAASAVEGRLTTEAVIDETFDCLIKCKINRTKYLQKAIDLIYSWYDKSSSHLFTVELSDILTSDNGDKIASEIISLYTKEAAQSTVERIMKEVAKRIFSLISASWFWASSDKDNEIGVRLMS